MKKYFKFISYIFVILMSIFITKNVYAEDKEYFSQDKKYAIKISNVYLYSEAKENGKNSIIKENISWEAEPKISVQSRDGIIHGITIKPTLKLNNEEIRKLALENKKEDGTFQGYIKLDYSLKTTPDMKSAFILSDTHKILLGLTIAAISNGDENFNLNDLGYDSSVLEQLPKLKKYNINNQYTEMLEGKLFQVRLDKNQNLFIDTYSLYEESQDGINITSRIALSEFIQLSKNDSDEYNFNTILNGDNSFVFLSENDEDGIESEIKNEKYIEYNFYESTEIKNDIFKNIGSKDGLIFNVKDENDNLLYSWKFYKEDVVNTNINLNLDILINKSDKKDLIENIYKGIDVTYLSFKHDGDFPGRASIKIKISDIYSNGDELYLYYFNENTNKLELVSEKNKVEDGYIEIEIDHASDYILTKDKIDVDAVYQDVKNPQTGVNHFITPIFTLLISGILIIVYGHKKNKFPQI